MGRAKKVKYSYYGYNAAGEIYAHSYNDGTNGIKVYNYSGNYVATGWNGLGVVQIDGKRTAIDSDGNFYITSGNTVIKYNSSGVAQWTYDIGVATDAIAVDDSTKDVYFSHRRGAAGYGATEKLTRLNSDGIFQQKYNVINSPTTPNVFDIDSQGNIYTGDNEANLYSKVLKNGTLAWSKSIPGSPLVGYTGNIYVDSSDNNYIYSNGGRVRKYDSNGNLLLEFTTSVPQISSTDNRNNIIVDFSGNIIVCGRAVSGNLAKFNSSGTLIWAKTLPSGGEARGIDVDVNGNVYVSTANAIPSNFISRYKASDGTIEWTNTTARSPLVINTRPIG